jgi:hypothetical protein
LAFVSFPSSSRRTASKAPRCFACVAVLAAAVGD